MAERMTRRRLRSGALAVVQRYVFSAEERAIIARWSRVLNAEGLGVLDDRDAGLATRAQIREFLMTALDQGWVSVWAMLDDARPVAPADDEG